MKVFTTSGVREASIRDSVYPPLCSSNDQHPQHPIFALGSPGIKLSIAPKKQTYHLSRAEASLAVPGWIACCSPFLQLPGLSKMLEACGTGDTHGASTTRPALRVESDPL